MAPEFPSQGINKVLPYLSLVTESNKDRIYYYGPQEGTFEQQSQVHKECTRTQLVFFKDMTWPLLDE